MSILVFVFLDCQLRSRVEWSFSPILVLRLSSQLRTAPALKSGQAQHGQAEQQTGYLTPNSLDFWYLYVGHRKSNSTSVLHLSWLQNVHRHCPRQTHSCIQQHLENPVQSCELLTQPSWPDEPTTSPAEQPRAQRSCQLHAMMIEQCQQHLH